MNFFKRLFRKKTSKPYSHIDDVRTNQAALEWARYLALQHEINNSSEKKKSIEYKHATPDSYIAKDEKKEDDDTGLVTSIILMNTAIESMDTNTDTSTNDTDFGVCDGGSGGGGGADSDF